MIKGWGVTDRGVVENRRFLLVDGEGRRLRSSLTVWPIAVRGAYDARAETLRMSLPDGTTVEGSALGEGELVRPEFHHGVVEARVVRRGSARHRGALEKCRSRLSRFRRGGR